MSSLGATLAGKALQLQQKIIINAETNSIFFFFAIINAISTNNTNRKTGLIPIIIQKIIDLGSDFDNDSTGAVELVSVKFESIVFVSEEVPLMLNEVPLTG